MVKYTAVIQKTTYEDCTVEIDADNDDDAEAKFDDIRRKLDDNLYESDEFSTEMLKAKVDWCNAEWQLGSDDFEIVEFSEGGL